MPNPNSRPYTIVFSQTSGSVNSLTGDYPFTEIQLSGSNLNIQTDSSGALTASRNGTFATISASSLATATLSASAAWAGNLNASQSTFYTTNITSTLNATNYSVGALVVAGGAAVDLDLFVGGNSTILGDTTIAGNLNVLGTSSIVEISSSTLVIGANRIRLNSFSPSTVSQRWAGLDIVDSGSFNNNVTSSLLWDSSNNYWLLMSDQAGGTIITSSAIIIQGPTSTFGSELLPIANNFLKAQNNAGNLTSSNLSEIIGVLQYNGSATFLNITASNFVGTSSWCNTALAALTASSLNFTVATSSYANTASYLPVATYQFTSSWSVNSLTSSLATSINFTASNSTFSQTASVSNNLNSANSYTINSLTANAVAASAFTGSLYGTGSWSLNSVNSTNAITSQTASYIDAGGITTGIISNAILPSQINVTAVTASLVGTASWSTFSATASSLNFQVSTASYSISSLTASYLTPSLNYTVTNFTASGTGSFAALAIGTSSPTKVLTVNGTANIATGSISNPSISGI